MLRLVGLMVALSPLPAAAQSLREALPPGIVIQGRAVIETAPDIAELSISLRGDGTTADAASKALADAQKAVIGGIASLDPKARYRTGDVSMRAVRKGDCAASDDLIDLAQNRDDSDTGPCRVVGYIATIDATMELRAVDQAGTAIGLANRLGASSAELKAFRLSDPAAARRAAMAAAIADARTRAESLATASGARLGPVVSILDGRDREADTMMLLEAPAMAVAPQELLRPVKIDISPAPVETSAEIVIVYALIK